MYPDQNSIAIGLNMSTFGYQWEAKDDRGTMHKLSSILNFVRQEGRGLPLYFADTPPGTISDQYNGEFFQPGSCSEGAFHIPGPGGEQLVPDGSAAQRRLGERRTARRQRRNMTRQALMAGKKQYLCGPQQWNGNFYYK